jgi:cytochrome c peroxidase
MAFTSESNRITISNVATAIAAFEATLITPNAPFDKYLRGDEAALTAEQKQGLQLFINKGCSSCHAGINTGQIYAPFGVVERPGADYLLLTIGVAFRSHAQLAMNMSSASRRCAILP